MFLLFPLSHTCTSWNGKSVVPMWRTSTISGMWRRWLKGHTLMTLQIHVLSLSEWVCSVSWSKLLSRTSVLERHMHAQSAHLEKKRLHLVIQSDFWIIFLGQHWKKSLSWTLQQSFLFRNSSKKTQFRKLESKKLLRFPLRVGIGQFMGGFPESLLTLRALRGLLRC